MRQAKGLTQKKLGDMLYVSNKTVSRWERDECMPDLALIPAIAEIFGITSDELLRGERNNAENADNTPSNLLGKGEKRALVMVERRLKHFSMLTAIPAVLSFAGLTTAVLLNLLLYEGLIGFFVAAGCCLGSAIIEVCLAITYSLRRTEEFAAIAARVRAVQNIITRTDAGIIAADICIVAFCTPLAAYLTGGGMRLAAESWLTSGLEITCCTGAVIFAAYGVFIRPALIGRGALYFSPERAAQRDISENSGKNGLCGRHNICFGRDCGDNMPFCIPRRGLQRYTAPVHVCRLHNLRRRIQRDNIYPQLHCKTQRGQAEESGEQK